MSRILLLEPNRLLSKQYRTYLKGEGHSVICCETAQGAINAADGKAPDLVIADLLLMGHSGLEFLYEFRSYAEWRGVPALILSSISEREAAVSLSSLKELGVVAFLYKPATSLARLGQQVSRVLLPSNAI